MFLSVTPGWPGAFHDARILGASGVKQLVECKQWLAGWPVIVEGVAVKPYLLGDSGYPMYEWLMTPHPSDHLRKWRGYNYEHSRSRIIIEKSFGMLKRRFSILSKPIAFMTENVCDIFIVCCILHNMIAKDVWEETIPPPSDSEQAEDREPVYHIVDQGGHSVRELLMSHVNKQ